MLDFAQTFREDLLAIAPSTHIPPVQLFSSAKQGNTVLIDVDPSLNLTLFNGNPTDEGYKITVTQKIVSILAPAPIGAWWGTRTLLQQIAFALANNGEPSLPAGEIVDSPGWEVRGFMLDAGRHWFDTNFLCAIICVYVNPSGSLTACYHSGQLNCVLMLRSSS